MRCIVLCLLRASRLLPDAASAAAPLDELSCMDWPLIVRACEGHEGLNEDTLRVLLGSGKLQHMFAQSAEMVLAYAEDSRGDQVLHDVVRALCAGYVQHEHLWHMCC
jgi:hypothetical protein